MNVSDNDTSLIGRNDAIRLVIIKIKPRGKTEEVLSAGEEGSENVQRVKMMLALQFKRISLVEWSSMEALIERS